MSDANAWTIQQLLEHAEWIRKLAHILVRDPATADDLAQDTWVQALRSPPREAGPLKPWLATILRNLVRERFRKTDRRERRERAAVGPTELAPADDLAQRAEAQKLVVEFVLELPSHYRDVVLLSYFEGLTGPEIAERMGIPEVTVRSRLKRGLDQLRERFDRKYGDRKAWVVMLMPLARPGDGGATGGGVDAGIATDGAASSAAFSVAAKILISAASAILVTVCWVMLGDRPLEQSPGVVQAVEQATLREPVAATEGDRTTPPSDVEAVSVAPVPTLEFVLEVTDSAGRPIPGAEVDVSRCLFGKGFSDLFRLDHYPTEPVATATTAADGAFRMSALRGDSFDLDIRARGHGSRFVQGVNAGQTLRVTLHPAASVTGTVLRKGSNEPVAGALIRANRPKRSAVIAETRSRSDGSYRLDDLPAGELIFFAYAPVGPLVFEVANLDEGRSHAIDFLVKPSIEVRGHVVDAVTQSPVVGARVRSTMNSTTTTTDGDGRFVWPCFYGFELDVVSVEADGYGVKEFWPDVRPGSTFVECAIALDPGVTIRGALVDSRGSFLAGARVVAVAFEPAVDHPAHGWPGFPRTELREVTTDAVGAFSFEGLRSDLPHAVLVADPRVADCAFDVPFRANDSSVVDVGVLRVPDAVTLYGRLVDANGAHVANHEVRLMAISDPRVSLTKRNTPWTTYVVEVGSRFTDSDGNFCFPRAAPGLNRLDAVPERGSAFGVTSVLVKPDERSKEVLLRDVVRAEIAGVVRDEAGNPVPFGEVQWVPVKTPTAQPGVVRCDPDGRFQIKGLEAGTYAVRAWVLKETPNKGNLRPSAKFAVEAGRTDLDLVLPPAHWLEVAVFDAASNLVAGAEVKIEGPDPDHRASANTSMNGTVKLAAPVDVEVTITATLPAVGGAAAASWSVKHRVGSAGETTRIEMRASMP